MNVSIFGLGYVGAVSAACLAELGHTLIGVDPNSDKVDLINAGRSPVVEAELEELTRRAVQRKQLRAVQDPQVAVYESDITLICVATPSKTNGDLDFRFLEKVCTEIGTALASKSSFHVVVVRSTILPGTLRGVLIPLLERYSGRKAGTDFGVCNNPEFLREGTAIRDFRSPPRTVIGATDSRSADMVQSLYEGVPGPVIRCPIEVGEMVKYADNTWHAVKVAFANEIGKICKSAGVDSHAVMEIFCKDTKLNLSPYYLRPGFAFGGSCLPKDLRALTYRARSRDVSTPLLNSLMFSNHEQIEHGLSLVMGAGQKAVGILGFSFKAGTDDLRESPIVILAEALLGKGVSMKIYDKNVSMAKLVGANKDYIVTQIPHLSSLLCNTIAEVIDGSDVIVVGNQAPEFAQAVMTCRPDQIVIDLVRLPIYGSLVKADYRGICW
jgi:GDP-mannose 6-dehydrogenase